ncbi:MAG: LuxR C-terminal-related transcriptional regulator [Anaerolineae bacterium]
MMIDVELGQDGEMAPALLTTKLYIPPVRRELVTRPKLLERLNAGLNRKLTLVSAPAGYGKTTLISAWLHTADLPFTWLSLDKGDNDPIRFFTYLVAALQEVDAQMGCTVQERLEAPQPPSLESLVAMLINDIASTPRRFIVVLDDHHTIVERAIHEGIRFLVDRQPPQMHLVIATRQDPPLPISRLRARGELTEIRRQELRFTPEETADFFNRSLGLGLSASEMAILGERTEGWIVGLQLAGLSMQGHDVENRTRFIDEFSGRHHFILDYLTDEVLRRQPEPIQTFLLQTCILDRMCGPLCDALAGQKVGPEGALASDGQTTLERLQGANLFVVPLDDERKWYRYHQLFAQLLRARLHETYPGRAIELHRRAVAWYEETGLGYDAVRHAIATRDDALAAAVMERAILKLDTWMSVDITTVLGWIKALPDEVVRTRPWLRLFMSRTLYITGHRAAADQILQELEEWLQDNADVPEAEYLLGLALADRAGYASVHGELRQTRELAERMLARAARSDVVTRVRALAISGMAHYRAGALEEAYQAFSEAVDAGREEDGIRFAIGPIVSNLAEIQFVQGHLRLAWQTCQQAVEIGTVDGQRHATTGFARLEQAKISYEWNDLETAERSVLEGLELLRRGGIGEHFGNMHAVLAQIRQAQGDPAGARAAILEAVQMAESAGIRRLSIQARAYQTRIWLAQGELELVSRWARDYDQIGETEYLREFEDLTLVRVSLAEGQPAEALALLDSLLRGARAAGRGGRVIEVLALRSLAHQAQGHTTRALDDLARALQLAEPEGFVRTFVDEGDPMATLLRQAASQGIAPAYASRLLSAFRASESRAPIALSLPAQPLVEPLSKRELEVLDLLAEGLTNAEIAQRLVVSVPTVKSHTRSIYGKVGVHSRKEAVAQARELGILPLP